MSVGTGIIPRTDSISADKDFLMAAKRPTTIPRETGYWQATLCSIGLHVLLLVALGIGATHHDSGSAFSNIQRQSFAPSKATAIAGSTASSTTLPAIKSAGKETTAGSPVVDARPARSEKKILPTIATSKPATRIVREEKYPRQGQLAALIKNGRFVEKKQDRNRQNSLTRQREQQKFSALAHQIRRKQEATRAETLAKKRAAELVAKMATATQRRKELAEERSSESLRQEEMRRITSGLAGNGGSGNS